MNATGAVVFLPREGNGPSLMLEELLFDPAALWLAESLRAAGVERFFVVCHTDDQARAAACFPAGTEFVTGGSGDAVEQLSAFLNALEGGDARTLAGLENGGVLDSKDTGVYRIDGGLLSQTLAEGVGLEEALKEKGDRFNSRGVWFQGAYPIRSGWNGRMEAEMVARQHGVRRLLEAGVCIMDPSHCYVGPRVKVRAPSCCPAQSCGGRPSSAGTARWVPTPWCGTAPWGMASPLTPPSSMRAPSATG